MTIHAIICIAAGNIAFVIALLAFLRGREWQFWAFLSTFNMLAAATALIGDIPN